MRYCSAVKEVVIGELVALDVRFPTSLTLAGSDAVHTSPDYSAAYAVLHCTGTQLQGHGLTFTCGRGTDLVADAIRSYAFLVQGTKLHEILDDFRGFWRRLANEQQLRWLGPEKGSVHLALAAVINAVWDLWAKLEEKPLWKLIADMTPEEIVSVIEFRHITDVLTENEALQILRANQAGKAEREAEIEAKGVPAYITSVGWMGYSDEKIKALCREALAAGWRDFKMKVGVSLEDDKRRAGVIREVIGWECRLMMDANQVWDVGTAIEWTTALAEFKPTWMEEPTSPDDVLGHAKIAKALAPLGIGVATGEHCQNRVVFKQLLESGAVQFCQIDACRLGGPNEVLPVLLMAAKLGVPVCPHAGGVGLCEYVRHLAIINYLVVAPSWRNTLVEFADHLHEHFLDPATVAQARYLCPTMPGYSAQLKPDSLASHTFPAGQVWLQLAKEGKSQYH